MDNIELVKMAAEAKEFAYAPYSKFRVGAALLAQSGKVYKGCNVESASLGGTNCAERTALFKAVSEGERKFSKIAVIGDSPNLTFPCGICRQVLAEFGTDLEVIVADKDMNYKSYTLKEILPFAFTGEELEAVK